MTTHPPPRATLSTTGSATHATKRVNDDLHGLVEALPTMTKALSATVPWDIIVSGITGCPIVPRVLNTAVWERRVTKQWERLSSGGVPTCSLSSQSAACADSSTEYPEGSEK
jgi:hypothetical protein